LKENIDFKIKNMSGKAAKPKDYAFEWSKDKEPHATRRRELRKKYGKKISALEGHDPSLKYYVFAAFFVQLATCYYVTQVSDSLLLYFASMYIIGGTLNNTLGLSLHELSHGLGFKKFSTNIYFGIFANLPLGIPISVSFRRYHLEHHQFQGEDMVDSDIPTDWELSFFRSRPMKFLWLILNPLFYAIRPLFVLPKKTWSFGGVEHCCSVIVRFTCVVLLGFPRHVLVRVRDFVGTWISSDRRSFRGRTLHVRERC